MKRWVVLVLMVALMVVILVAACEAEAGLFDSPLPSDGGVWVSPVATPVNEGPGGGDGRLAPVRPRLEPRGV